LNIHLEILRRTICARSGLPLMAGPPGPAICVGGPGFASDLDGDGMTGEMDPNSDGQGVCPGPGWAAAGHPFGAADVGCDGPEYYVGLSEARNNEDGDGVAYLKGRPGPPSQTPPLAFGAGGMGGCTSDEEAALGLSDTVRRDFRDVNHSGKVDGTDIGMVRAAFGDEATLPGTGYRRILDLDSPAASPNGSGKIDATDIGMVRAQFMFDCTPAP